MANVGHDSSAFAVLLLIAAASTSEPGGLGSPNKTVLVAALYVHSGLKGFLYFKAETER